MITKTNIRSNKVLKKNSFKSGKLLSESSNVASYFVEEKLLLDDIRQHLLSLECVSFQVVQKIM